MKSATLVILTDGQTGVTCFRFHLDVMVSSITYGCDTESEHEVLALQKKCWSSTNASFCTGNCVEFYVRPILRKDFSTEIFESNKSILASSMPSSCSREAKNDDVIGVVLHCFSHLWSSSVVLSYPPWLLLLRL